MAGGTLATGAAAAVGTIVAAAAAGFIAWHATAPQRAQFLGELQALNTKIDKADVAIADLKKAPAAPSTSSGVDAALSALATRLDATTKSLAALDKTLAEVKAASSGIGDLKSAAVAQQQSLQQIAASLDTIKTMLEAQKATISASSAPATTVAKDESKIPTEHDLVVVYAPGSAGGNTAAPPPLSVRFDRIGAVNAGAQTQKLAGDIKKIIEGRKNCVVSVAGFADTLGTDKVNLAVSRERAESVAAGLRSALVGQGVEVKEVAWGERHLAVWTPDNKSEKANRRVDINVACKD